MILSKTDLRQIREFVAKRGFTELDLQMEIIDHVACRVEALMIADSKLDLQQAIKLVHAEFGVMGFSVFEDGMRATLQKRYWRIFKGYFKSVFNWKIIPPILALIYLSSLIFMHLPEPGYLFGVTGGLLLLTFISSGIFNEVKFKRYTKMLTFKMGNIYLLIISALFQIYNLLIIQLKLYQYLSPALTGVLFAVLAIIIFATFYSVLKTQLKAVKNWKKSTP